MVPVSAVKPGDALYAAVRLLVVVSAAASPAVKSAPGAVRRATTDASVRARLGSGSPAVTPAWMRCHDGNVVYATSTCPNVRWPGATPTTVSLVPSRSIVSTSPTSSPAVEPTTIPSSAPTDAPSTTGGARKPPPSTPNRARSTGPRGPEVFTNDIPSAAASSTPACDFQVSTWARLTVLRVNAES